MLAHLRQRIEHSLQRTPAAVLSTAGPCGLQAGHFPCEYRCERLYLLVPATLDLLENLVVPLEVLVTAPGWQIQGKASLLAPCSHPAGLSLLACSGSRWSAVVEIQPIRIQLQPQAGYPTGETIDFDLERNEK